MSLCCGFDKKVKLYKANLLICIDISDTIFEQINKDLLSSTHIVRFTTDYMNEYKKELRNYVWDNIGILSHGKTQGDNFSTIGLYLPDDKAKLLNFLRIIRKHTSGCLDWFSCNMGESKIIRDLLFEIDTTLKFPLGISVSINTVDEKDWTLEYNTKNNNNRNILRYVASMDLLKNITLWLVIPKWFTNIFSSWYTAASLFYSYCTDSVNFIFNNFTTIINSTFSADFFKFNGLDKTKKFINSNFQYLTGLTLYTLLLFVAALLKAFDIQNIKIFRIDLLLNKVITNSALFSKPYSLTNSYDKSIIPDRSNLLKYQKFISPVLFELSYALADKSHNELLSRSTIFTQFLQKTADEEWSIIGTGTFDNKFKSCLIFLHKYNKTAQDIYVVFKGTSTTFDVLVDSVQSAKTENIFGLPTTMKIMDGAESYYNKFIYENINGKSKIYELIDNLDKTSRISNVVFIGHSLAGSFATIGLTDYMRNRVSKSPIPHLYTYSSASTGNTDFYNYLYSLLPLQSNVVYTRVYEDIVPTGHSDMFEGITFDTLSKVHDTNLAKDARLIQFNLAVENKDNVVKGKEIIIKSGKNSIFQNNLNITSTMSSDLLFNHATNNFISPVIIKAMYGTSNPNEYIYNQYINS